MNELLLPFVLLLLYCELFETYYPDRVAMIPNFRMPNKTWPGCCVDDPSARVFSNCGASGEQYAEMKKQRALRS
ncbi:MAG: hypothetical protein IKN04_02645 [Clostridia bacterium]|nr:hypothetical protein [Clostridia bacterium]